MALAVPSQKPDRLIAVAVMTLVSGILNLFWSVGIFIAIAVFGVGTFLIGCICLPLGIYPLALGILEIVYAAKLLGNPASPNLKPAYHIAIMEIIDTLFGNLPALIVGVAALILYNDVAVRRYFGET
ncbi:MAG: hypothetical protein JW748_10545 [Anaerolineales bacterium]|nr:hypothetical protein [Anaerolineales bacterium]